MRPQTLWAVAASAIIALAVWPLFVKVNLAHAMAPAATFTPAPPNRDDLRRDSIVSALETQLKKNGPNFLVPRLLSAQYLQRYRERGDIDDVLRAQHDAQLSLDAQTRGNVAGELSLADALLTLHRFREARVHVNRVVQAAPGEDAFIAQEASLDLETGDYTRAQRELAQISARGQTTDPVQTIESRYDELTGRLGDARRLLRKVTGNIDSLYDISAERRAWFHMREGEMAFTAGDLTEAVNDEHEALIIFPNFNRAFNALARFELAQHHDREALDAATKGAAIVPLPETLGYQADAQRALGDAAAANRTNDEIEAIEKIGNAQRVNDRLLAIYYDEHDMKLADAYTIAKREVTVRDDVFAEDTIAWAAAKVGKWDEARSAIANAQRYHTQDSRISYHAGVIAQHFNDSAKAKADFTQALALNSAFHPVYADDARTRLSKMSTT